MTTARPTFPGSNGSAWPASWTTFGAGATQQSATGETATDGTGGYGGYAEGKWNVEELPDIDVTVLLTPGQTWATECFPAITLDGGSGFYQVVIQGSSGNYELRSGVGGVLATKAYSYTGSNPIYVRLFRAADGRLKAKVWEGATEPAAWGAEAVSTTETGTFYVSFGITGGAAAAIRSCRWSEISIENMRGVEAGDGGFQVGASYVGNGLVGDLNSGIVPGSRARSVRIGPPSFRPATPVRTLAG